MQVQVYLKKKPPLCQSDLIKELQINIKIIEL